MKRDRGWYARLILLGCLVLLVTPRMVRAERLYTSQVTRNLLYGTASVENTFAQVQQLEEQGRCLWPTPETQTFPGGQVYEFIEFPDTYVPIWPWDLEQHISAEHTTARGEPIPFFCQPQTLTDDTLTRHNAEAINGLERGLISFVIKIFWLYTQVGVWLLNLAGKLLAFALGASSFITSPIVRIGWPFVQGFANLGFILALLFIAFATTLQLEVGGNWRRLLPRLLLAALLINFSLIIGGILIDASRILMAVLARVMGSTTLTDIGYDLLSRTAVVTAVWKIQAGSFLTIAPVTSWSQTLQAAQALIVIWGLVAGFLVVALMLLMRYVMLLLLLIFSPFAYLAMAMPGAQSWAKKWWSEFIKWVLYGPLALFMLILVMQLGGSDAVRLSQSGGDNFYWSLISVAMAIILLFMAAFAGKRFSAVGSNVVMDFATKRGRQIGGAVAGGHKFVGKAAAKSVYESKPLARIRQPIRAAFGAYEAQQKRYADQKKKEKGAGAARYNLSPEQRQQRQKNVTDAKAVLSNPATATSPAAWRRANVNATTLRQGYMTEGIGKDDVIDKIALHTDQSSDISALVNNPDFMKELAKDQTGALQTKLIANIRNNNNFKVAPGVMGAKADQERFKIQERLVRDALGGLTKAQDKLASGGGDDKKK